MTAPTDPFRDFGIALESLAPPADRIRAAFSPLTRLGQYLFSFIFSVGGLATVAVFAIGLRFPMNLLAAGAMLAALAYVIFRVTQHDYAWVELDGHSLRAKHLYTGRVVLRSIDEIEDLLTMVFLRRSLTTRITDAWIGRVRAIRIRFQDARTPLVVCRADPKMTNAKELIEAIAYRMAERRAIDAEIIDLEGRPLVRRIYWKAP